jgi:co-chaperonin GroES (HSP10)
MEHPALGANDQVEASKLAPRLIQGMSASYVVATYDGQNTSGLEVYGKNVLVLVDECAVASSGGILLTDSKVEQMTEASVTGCIFALGPEAFRMFDDGTYWDGAKPEVGDRIYFEKYAGIKCRGLDGGFFRVMDFRTVAAKILPGAEMVEA